MGIKVNLSTLEMLERLQYSKNINCAAIAKRILAGVSSVEYELKYTGGFMTAVLEGDYQTAISRADYYNKEALNTVIN